MKRTQRRLENQVASTPEKKKERKPSSISARRALRVKGRETPAKY